MNISWSQSQQTLLTCDDNVNDLQQQQQQNNYIKQSHTSQKVQKLRSAIVFYALDDF